MLVVYAPCPFITENNFVKRYPGDEIVDILGFDSCFKSNKANSNNGDPSWENFKLKLLIVNYAATAKRKPFIIAEKWRAEYYISPIFYAFKGSDLTYERTSRYYNVLGKQFRAYCQ